MKLKTLTNFILDKNESCLFKYNAEHIRTYVKFLQKELKLSMFIPCDQYDVPYKGVPLSPNTDAEWLRWENERDSYHESLEDIIFKNVTHKDNGNGFLVYSVGKTEVFTISKDGKVFWYFNTMEGLGDELDDSIEIVDIL